MGRMALRLAALVASAMVCLAASTSARAAGRFLPVGPGSVEVREVELARSYGSDRVQTWLRVRVRSAAPFVWVLPLPAGALVDPASASWLEALDEASAPRIRPPLGQDQCNGAPISGLDPLTAPAVKSLRQPTQIVVEPSADGAVQALAQLGVETQVADQARLAQYGQAGQQFLILAYESLPQGGAIEALRWTQPLAGAALDLSWIAADAGVPLRVFSIAEGRARWPQGLELTPADLSISWLAAQAKSDYRERREDALGKDLPSLLEAQGSHPLFRWTILSQPELRVAPATRDYFDREVGSEASGKCLLPLSDALDAGQLGARLSPACAGGSLAKIPGPSVACPTEPSAGEISAAALACAGADDLELAFGGLNLAGTELTRHALLLTPERPPLLPDVASGAPQSLVVTAAEVDLKGCVTRGGQGGYGGGSNTGGYYGGGYGGGYAGGYGAWGGGGFAQDEPIDDGDTVVIVADSGASCSGSSSDSSDGSCSGDTSDTSEEDSCSGDSSDSSDSCSGDSSDSSDSCSGDSSDSSDSCSGDSSESGSACSGDSSSGGDSCSGSSSDSGCTVHGRQRRVRMSAATWLLAFLALPLRRMGKRRRGCRRARRGGSSR